ncbi:MAG: hypothetical protein ABJP45_00080 [Cyclobacteriaceae bacterium]
MTLYIAVHAQSNVLMKGQDQLFTDMGIIPIVGPASPKVKGDVYLFEKSAKCDLFFKASKTMEDVWINCDIYNSQLILLHNGKNFSIDFTLVDHFVVRGSNEKFVNSSNLKGVEPNLALKVLVESPNLSLYQKTELKVLKPSYNEQLGIGTKDTRIVSSSLYLLFEKEKESSLVFKTSRNSLKPLDYYNELKEFMKANSYDLENEGDAVEIIKFYESLKYK